MLTITATPANGHSPTTYQTRLSFSPKDPSAISPAIADTGSLRSQVSPDISHPAWDEAVDRRAPQILVTHRTFGQGIEPSIERRRPFGGSSCM
jgi:hypothetical protein